MPITPDTAQRLRSTAKAFAAADEDLQQVEEPSEYTAFVPDAATNYIEKRRAHQAAIEAAEQEYDAETGGGPKHG